MSREVHVRFCQRPEVKFLRPPHPYVKVQGRWCYLYRAIDTSGALVDVMLSKARDMAAAMRFFRSAKTVTGITPARVTTDGHDSYPRAIRTELGAAIAPIAISTTGLSRIIAAPRADTSRCVDSRAACPLRGFLEAMTNFETSSGPGQIATNTSPPITADCTSSPVPSRRSASYKLRDGRNSPNRTNYPLLARGLTEPFLSLASNSRRLPHVPAGYRDCLSLAIGYYFTKFTSHLPSTVMK
jgi:hypothetical protein